VAKGPSRSLEDLQERKSWHLRRKLHQAEELGDKEIEEEIRAVRAAMAECRKPQGPPNLDDLWKRTDAGSKAVTITSFEEMDVAKSRRTW
jgi:hypothetical protein